MTNFKVTEDKYILEELTMRTLNFNETASNPVNKEGGDWQKKKKKDNVCRAVNIFFPLPDMMFDVCNVPIRGL